MRKEEKEPLMTTPDYNAVVSCASVANLKQRAKRRRQCSSLPSPASSSSHGGSTTTTQQEEDEEEDMAKCLILLAQGPTVAVGVEPMPEPPSRPRNTSRRYTAEAGGSGVSYECKTCNRCFPSFQALGGHRTSHNNDKKQPRRPEAETPPAAVTTTLSLRTAAGNAAASSRPAHECSACGAVFTSGQALGGHMRRHRPLNMSMAVAAPESVVTSTEDDDSSSKLLLMLQERSSAGNINLDLDLNLLPAPSTEQEVTSPAKPCLLSSRMHQQFD